MKKILLLALPFAALLAGCGSDRGSSYSYSEPVYSSPSSSGQYSQSYSQQYPEATNASRPPYGGYPVNPNATVKTG